MLLYNLAVRIYGCLIAVTSLWNHKAALWVNGRRNWQHNLEKKVSSLPPKRIWFHCASYGEFEQGRPLMDALIKQYPSHAIVLSFFSPSGYEAFKHNSGAHLVCYLPLDTKKNADRFIKMIKPSIAIFVKYEFWINFLSALKKNKIPTFLVSAVFKPHHTFFKWYGATFRRSLSAFKTMFLQDKASALMLDGIGISNHELSGDTRFDRVVEVKKNFTPIDKIARFKAGSKLIAAGSTWPKDEELVLEAFGKIKSSGFRLLLVPHEIDDASLRGTETRIKTAGFSYALYTSAGQDIDADVLVLNTMGLLSRSYYYADVAYIGGGFNNGLHNTLEPSVFGNGVTFYGNTYQRYVEASELVGQGLAEHVKDAESLAKAWLNYSGPSKEATSKKLEEFYAVRIHATARIISAISEHLS